MWQMQRRLWSSGLFFQLQIKRTKCGNESLWTTIPRYILVAYGPLTVFLAVIVVFTISINSAAWLDIGLSNLVK